MYLKFFLLIFITFFSLNIYATEYKKVAYLEEVNSDLKYKNSTSALKIWIKDLTKDVGVDIKVTTYKKMSRILDDFLESKIDILGLHPLYYLQNQNMLDNQTILYWDFQKNKKHKFQKMYVIVNKNKNINSFEDLLDKKIAIKKSNYLGKMFLEKLFLEKMNRNSKDFISKLNLLNNNTALIKTYFGSYDACIIDSYDYEVMLELNPAIKNKIKILEESERFFNYYLILFSMVNSDLELDIYKNTLNSFFSDSRKNSFYDLLKIENVRTLKSDDLENLRQFYQEYQALNKKYK